MSTVRTKVLCIVLIELYVYIPMCLISILICSGLYSVVVPYPILLNNNTRVRPVN